MQLSIIALGVLCAAPLNQIGLGGGQYKQFSGSFKERGARNALLQLPEAQKKKGVIAASAGNHALGSVPSLSKQPRIPKSYCWLVAECFELVALSTGLTRNQSLHDSDCVWVWGDPALCYHGGLLGIPVTVIMPTVRNKSPTQSVQRERWDLLCWDSRHRTLIG